MGFFLSTILASSQQLSMSLLVLLLQGVCSLAQVVEAHASGTEGAGLTSPVSLEKLLYVVLVPPTAKASSCKNKTWKSRFDVFNIKKMEKIKLQNKKVEVCA